MFTDQAPYDVRFEWGERGLDAVSGDCGVIVIVDVFSFSTAVDVVTSHGAIVFPSRMRDEAAAAFAEAHGAILAADIRTTDRRSLSPTSLVGIDPGTRLVLPSRNGATLSLKAPDHAVIVTACLRNAAAVARFVGSQRSPVAVIGGGERWPDDTLRPAWEDLIGAGAVIDGLKGTLSPEAEAARDAFRAASSHLPQRLRACSSGRELTERGFPGDIAIASAVDVSQTVPILIDHAYVRSGG